MLKSTQANMYKDDGEEGGLGSAGQLKLGSNPKQMGILYKSRDLSKRSRMNVQKEQGRQKGKNELGERANGSD
ncbi:hypothetical protein TWF694_000051 [Orbilia ellipsospora]|uniref:Uncharacterized protein n=1 Tax=Orbilia ellipsospora TaxID=2528407 RepID=A0AAV9XMH1_9PEZI